MLVSIRAFEMFSAKTMIDLAYYEVQDILKNALKKNSGIEVIHDKTSAVKYFTYDTDQWISYDDKDTFKQKIDWANDVGFSGSLIWASDLGLSAPRLLSSPSWLRLTL
jgi:GH18 family chitinase